MIAVFLFEYVLMHSHLFKPSYGAVRCEREALRERLAFWVPLTVAVVLAVALTLHLF